MAKSSSACADVFCSVVEQNRTRNVDERVHSEAGIVFLTIHHLEINYAYGLTNMDEQVSIESSENVRASKIEPQRPTSLDLDGSSYSGHGSTNGDELER